MDSTRDQRGNGTPRSVARLRSNLAQRRSRALVTRALRRHGNGFFQLPVMISRLLRHSRTPWFGFVMLVLGAGALLVASGPRLSIQRAGAAAAPHVYTGRAQLSSRGPSPRHWTDLGHGTTLAIAAFPVGFPVGGAPSTAPFAFGLPDGNSLIGELSFKVDDSTQPATAIGSASDCGLVTHALPPDTIYYYLQVRVDQTGLAAFAQAYYVLPNSKGTSDFCQVPQQVGTLAELDAGCTSDGCGTNPLDTAAPAVASFDGSLVQSASSGDWTAVYKLSSESISGQYTTPDDFAAAMRQQQSQVGTITGISSLTTAPLVQLDATGQAYFAVTQTVTLDKGGSTSTRGVTSYYVLEDGRWLFWFSA
jgi:hypothetical protein